MKLGIIVVYLFDESTEYLLDLHLKQIRKFTDVPYTIYASANRLNSENLEKLKSYLEVQICEIPTTALRGADEHAYYLNRLTKIAIEASSTHVVTLHLDSFPVSLGWAKKFGSIVDKTGSCIALDRAYTACLFFPKSFYYNYRPSFDPFLPEQEKDSDKYNLQNHSGVAFLYACYIHHLPPLILKKNSKKPAIKAGDIFGKAIFHFEAVITLSEKFGNFEQNTKNLSLNFYRLKFKKWSICSIDFFIKHLSSERMRRWIRKKFPNSPLISFRNWLIRQRESIKISGMQLTKKQLTTNPPSDLFEPEISD